VDADGNDITDPALIPPPVRSLQRSRQRRPPRPPREQAEHDGEDREDGEEDGDTPTVSRLAIHNRPRRERTIQERYIPPVSTPRPRYSSAAAAAAASQQSDGYKPREERSWEDFHPDLDIDAGLFVFTADEVDGRTPRLDIKSPLLRTASALAEERPVLNGDLEMKDAPAEGEVEQEPQSIVVTPVKRKPGRPPRRPESMLSGLGSPPAPRIMPLPTHNPKERLNLPKPSFRQFNHFLQYEEDAKENKVNYVDRAMSNVGYEETDRYTLPPDVLVRLSEAQQAEDEAEVSLKLESDGPELHLQGPPVVGKVEYDMDEQDVAWLDDVNEQRRAEGFDAIKPAIFEITMTQIEKEYHALEKRIPKPQPRHAQTHRPRSSSQAAVNGDPNPPGDEPDSKCSICDDGDCENANAIIFCDGCDLAVHQECYGVPFIPEGQWFCRKCKEIGRGTPTCIFCPNVDGAFKQTNTLRWSHLLCAIWIPEVTIANMTFMEPIMDVDKVPKGRWKLSCYICNQKMGACIQCGNKNCYQAFHVTCARRAKLFLKMKSQHQQGIDTTALKAFCDKHVPSEWKRTHDTDNAIVEAKRWYRHAFKDRRWADSQTAALELGAPPQPDGGLIGETNIPDDTIAVTKRRRNQPTKMSWRLPSGAPVVPAVVFNSVDASMARFNIRKRKEFVEKAARYWTLKREARRGAALLKRLQLQLEGFSTMEVTRRNFAGMGAVGRPRLLRRIEFAELLQNDMAHLTELTASVKEREELRLKEVEVLRDLLDTVYFPIPAMLVPILARAQKYVL
jgi:NuA3 HAT complex component NTO1